MKAGGLYLNSVRATSAEALVSKDKHLLAGNITVVRVGESTSTSHFESLMLTDKAHDIISN